MNSSPTRLFESVLIANRGEIAVRIMRTLRRLGIRSVAAYSDADRDSLAVQVADVAVRIGAAPARESYLSVDAVIGAAIESGAQAIHPGYGFLSENPELARACAAHGIVFIGPPPEAIEAMGSKIAAKATVAAAGVRVVPGSDGVNLDDLGLVAAAHEIGFPVLLKPSAGGGGKGMRLVVDPSGLETAIASARREARASFADDTLLVERFVVNPRHIEIQILADAHGGIVHFGERECSLQRRHQKIIEEAPSPLLSSVLRAQMGAQAIDAARACGYVGAGTVEFIVSADRPDEFFFMEMNTRLQVEHPVTEEVVGVDLVEAQVRVAAGEPLAYTQEQVTITGHAVEARVYAEDPTRGFLPTGGQIIRMEVPTTEGVRLDSGVTDGSTVGSDYDPMLAKVIAWGADRDQALRRLDRALESTAVLGITTNIGFLRRLLADDDVRAGRLDTGLVERRIETFTDTDQSIEIAALTAAVDRLPPTELDAWSQLVGWRLGGVVPVRYAFDVVGSGPLTVTVDPLADRSRGGSVSATARVGNQRARLCTLSSDRRRMSIDGVVYPVAVAVVGATTHVSVAGVSSTVVTSVVGGSAGSELGAAGDGILRSPMPGTVIAVNVTVGDAVAAGQVVATVEAMKMEHSLVAPVTGTVVDVWSGAGATVALDQAVLRIEADVQQSADQAAG